MSDDSQLLRRFAADRSEAAFGELVTRHVSLVYSAALRQTGGDAHLAQDIAQLVFADLARKAAALSENVVLAGWLHRATIFAARQILRGERRRRLREQQAVTMNAIQSENENGDWQQIRPLLDEALERLNKTDRDALLLRFFENQNLAQVGANLGGSEDAARKRVNRALEKLRAILTKRGVTTTATALSTAISANAIQIAPAGLAATLTNTSIAAAGTGTFTLLKIMTATKLKLAFSAIVVASAATAIVVQHQTQNKLRGENQSLRQQVAQLEADSENFSNRLAEIGDAKKLSDERFNELLKLRGEVGILRRQVGEFRQLQEEQEQTNQSNQQLIEAAIKYEKYRESTRTAMITLGILMQKYASTHGEYATNFSQLSNEIANWHMWVLPDSIRTNAFEIINEGSVNIVTNTDDPDGNLIIARAKNSFQTPDGKWSRWYLLGGGPEEEEISTNGNFDAFEQQHMVSPPANGQ